MMLDKVKFKNEILKRISLKFQGRERRELEKIFLSRLPDRTEVFGSIFFDLIKLVQEDIDEVCNVLFDKKQFIKFNLFPTSDNKFRDFISPFTLGIQKIAEALISDTSRASKLKDGKIKNLYAHEVYGLSIAFNLKPSQLFNYLYGDGERPIVGLVPDGEVKGESEEE